MGDSSAAGPAAVDVVIVGFGFAGLATLAHLVARTREPLRVAIVASDVSGHGIAYQTREPAHLLNVPADRMGAWAHAPEDFCAWLRTSATAARCCAALGVLVPGPEDYAPRALFACYLDTVRGVVARQAHAKGVDVQWVKARAENLTRDGVQWRLTAGSTSLRARSCVLATGNEPRSVFGALDHPDLHEGPWQLTGPQVAGWEPRSVVLVGSGLTAIDALLSVRSLGFRGRIRAFSRSGQLPRAHQSTTDSLTLSDEQLGAIDSLESFLNAIRDSRRSGHDCRAVLDALRPYTPEIWQRFDESDQLEAVRHWSTVWSVHRHRLAPKLADRISEEIRIGQLRVGAIQRLTPAVHQRRLQLNAEFPDGTVEQLSPAAVIDCTGPELNWSHSRQTLLRGLLQDNICTPHHTGLGVIADCDHRVAENLYAIGSPLTGQLWESVAVPELRDQAATIAGRLT